MRTYKFCSTRISRRRFNMNEFFGGRENKKSNNVHIYTFIKINKYCV